MYTINLKEKDNKRNLPKYNYIFNRIKKTKNITWKEKDQLWRFISQKTRNCVTTLNSDDILGSFFSTLCGGQRYSNPPLFYPLLPSTSSPPLVFTMVFTGNTIATRINLFLTKIV